MRKKILRVLQTVFAFLLIICGLGLIINERVSEIHMSHVKEAVFEDESPCSVDWHALRQENSDIVGWLSVQNTSIDCAVVRPKDSDMEYYLNHDLWGSWTQYGTPFLDFRSSADAGTQLIYGHHINWSQAAFSELYDCWNQDRFDSLGSATWSTEYECDLRLKPLCALQVHEEDAEVQSIKHGNVSEVRAAMFNLCNRASALNPMWKDIIENSTRSLRLVTCSALTPGQPWRCCVVFAG